MNKGLARLFLLLLTLSSIPNMVSAQSTSAILTGKVLDEHHQPVKGVKIEITYAPWSRSREVFTDKRGNYALGNLPPGGPYSLKFTCNGYEEQLREILILEIGNNNDVSLHMRLETKAIAGIENPSSLSLNQVE